jgi:hypothetical protein
MQDKKLWEAQFDASGMDDTLINRHIFQVAFELGFQFGNSLPPMSIKPVIIFKGAVETNQALKELICMMNRISVERCNQLMDQFFKEQIALNRTYKDISDVNNHCRNWIKSQCGNPISPLPRINKL